MRVHPLIKYIVVGIYQPDIHVRAQIIRTPVVSEVKSSKDAVEQIAKVPFRYFSKTFSDNLASARIIWLASIYSRDGIPKGYICAIRLNSWR